MILVRYEPRGKGNKNTHTHTTHPPQGITIAALISKSNGPRLTNLTDPFNYPSDILAFLSMEIPLALMIG